MASKKRPVMPTGSMLRFLIRPTSEENAMNTHKKPLDSHEETSRTTLHESKPTTTNSPLKYQENSNKESIKHKKEALQEEELKKTIDFNEEKPQLSPFVEECVQSKQEIVENDISDYERMRLERIKANAAFLKSLGLEKKPLKQEKPSKKRPLPNIPPPSRRSLRRQCKDKVSDGLTATDLPLEAEKEEIAEESSEEETYTDSNVLKYMCQSTEVSNEPLESSSLLFKTNASHDRFDAQLKKIYTMDCKHGLVASGGHLGFTSIYAQDTVAGGTAPLHSYKAHQGWISSVKVLPPTATKSLFLTAANDAYVKIWDLNQKAKSNGLPKLEVSTNDLHSNGIFSLDLQNTNNQVKLLTCSKDQSVVLSILNSTGSIERLNTFEDHSSVVKCVRFSPHDLNMFASCSNDRSVIVRDVRAKADLTVFSDIHAQAVNCVRWHPVNATQIATSSFDGSLHVLDTRKPLGPVVTFGLAKTTKLFNHEFIQNEYIAVCLGKTLTLYCTTSGTIFSQGAMEYDADSIMSPSSSSILVAHKNTISLFTAS